MLLLIDNYDSFVHNLARYFQRIGQATQVVRNDAVTVDQIRQLAPAAVVLSPGPGTPQQAGRSLEIVEALHTELPMLGVCLGHQTIAEALGAQVVRSPQPMHGRTSQVRHHERELFQGASNPLTVCRYHSLAVDQSTLPEVLQVTAWTTDGVVMAIQHQRLPVFGLQFHPESILTEAGFVVLANFLRLAGLSGLSSSGLPRMSSELIEPRRRATPLPKTPVTF